MIQRAKSTDTRGVSSGDDFQEKLLGDSSVQASETTERAAESLGANEGGICLAWASWKLEMEIRLLNPARLFYLCLGSSQLTTLWNCRASQTVPLDLTPLLAVHDFHQQGAGVGLFSLDLVCRPTIRCFDRGMPSRIYEAEWVSPPKDAGDG